MATIVKLTGKSGGEVWINLDYALRLHPMAEGTRITYVAGQTQEEIEVKENPDLVANAALRVDLVRFGAAKSKK